MFTDKNGMTLYVSSLDKEGSSPVEPGEMWAPHMAKTEDQLSEGWTHVQRADGSVQLAYLGKLTYLFQGDRGKGDMRGEGLDGIWHVISD